MAKKKNIVRYTRKQIEALPDRTDWARVDAMRDKDIDCSDIPELTDAFWKNARLVIPHKKKSIGLRIDEDLLAWLKTSIGKGYQSHINAILRAYMFTRQDHSKH